MNPEEFVKAAEKRGVRMSIGHLEALHRSGDLVPLYRVHQGAEAIVKAWEPDGYIVPLPEANRDALQNFKTQGRLLAGNERFTSWANHVVQRGGRSLWVSVFLYSPWQ